MEIKKLIDEISEIESRIIQADNIIDRSRRLGQKLVVASVNDRGCTAYADQEFLIDAVKSQRQVYIERLEKLREAVRVVEKVIDGIVA